MLKRVLDSLDGLSDEIKAFYKEKEGKFYLQVDGGDVETPESVTALKNAKEHEKNLRVAAERERDAKAAEAETLTGERDTAISERDAANAAKGTDTAALEQSWKDKLQAEKDARAADVSERDSDIERLLVTSEAQRMAAEISTVPELLEDVIAKRLKVERGDDNKPFTRVLDDKGNPSAKTLDEFKQELLANEKYAAIIISSKGSGGGAGGSDSDGGADEKKSFWDYSDKELTEMRTNDPDRYKKLKAAAESGE